MKELREMYLRIASKLEDRWTSRHNKRIAAIFLRNAAIDTAHCYFCGLPAKAFDGELHESRYHPKVNICRFCTREIAQGFGLRFLYEPKLAVTYTCRVESPLPESSADCCAADMTAVG